MNRRNIARISKEADFEVHSDASDNALGVVVNNGLTCHRNFNGEERKQSSTFREISAILHGLKVFINYFKGKKVNWFLDNGASAIIIKKGSRKLPIHRIAIDIFDITTINKVDLEVNWVPRELNTTADLLSKYVDVDDCEVSTELFHILNTMWGSYSIDRFANYENKKVTRFNSRFFEIGSEGVDAFARSWVNDNNWLVPPLSDIPNVIKRFHEERVRGTLLVPYWTSAAFWPLLKNGESWQFFIKDFVLIKNARRYLKHGRCTFALLGSDRFDSPLIALKIES